MDDDDRSVSDRVLDAFRTVDDLEVRPVPIQGDAFARARAISTNFQRATIQHRQEELKGYFELGRLLDNVTRQQRQELRQSAAATGLLLHDFRTANRVYKLFQQDPDAIRRVNVPAREIYALKSRELETLVAEIREMDNLELHEIYLIQTIKIED